MARLKRLTGIAAPMMMLNIDTDIIFPKQHMKTLSKTNLGWACFSDWRYDSKGEMNPQFILNRAPYTSAHILIAGGNFGCGSSREHAVWALADFGFRCIIAPSFSDIFLANAVNSGILPAQCSDGDVITLAKFAEGADSALFTVDLEEQTIEVIGTGFRTIFEIDPTIKSRLLEDKDQIAATIDKLDKIEAFEEKYFAEHPWLGPRR